MSDITYSQYWDEINNIATELVSDAMTENDNDRDAAEELINDSRLHEWIDGHQWVIYTYAHDFVIRHSESDRYYEDIYCAEDIGQIVKDNGLDHMRMIQAFWCMYADVQEKLSDAFDEFEDNLEAA